MENRELQKTWRNMDTGIHQKSKDELNLLLKSKTKQMTTKFLVIIGISIMVSLGLMIFLIVTSLNRQNDLIYLINNLTLGIITIISIYSGLLSWYQLQNNKLNLSLKDWLQVKINLLTKGLTGKLGKLYLFIIPIIYVLTVLSIHVYYEHETFIRVIKAKESIFGLIFGIITGLFVSFYVFRKVRKYQLQNLKFLKNLYRKIIK